MPLPLYRPAPIVDADGTPIDRRTHFDRSARRLIAGETLILADRYRTGVGIVDALATALRPPPQAADFPTKQRFREAYRDAAWRLLAPVKAGRVDLVDAPANGFLRELYPDVDAFWLPFPEVRDLAHAWHLYDQGVHLPVLGHRLHPLYGTYLPKRTEHLELFATWLARWSGPADLAVDVGTGSGVLAFLLARAGVTRVIATDINPNAVESVRRDVARRPEPPPIEARQGDLLAGIEGPVDLVVFNPPWVEGPVDNLLDRALHYPSGLFDRFFDHADRVLHPDGRVVLVFSNILRLVQPDAPHPIDAELARGRFVCVDTLTRRIKPPRGARHVRRRTKERVEVWELARRP